MRWSDRLVLISLALMFCWLMLLQIPGDSSPPRHPEQPHSEIMRNSKKKVVIYAATKFFSMDITTERFLSKCESTKGYCRISSNPDDLHISDGVLFHNADYSPEAIPKPRMPTRPHILWSLESSTNDHFRPGPHVINWTMTFRQDADIWYPYGHFRPLRFNRSVDFDGIWNLKDSAKTAAWLASNCFAKSMRTDFVESLQKKGPYKFYIALENSNCIDYVTEKFYETLLYRMAVPIVLKRKTYIGVGAPPNSFIALDDFETLDELVAFVNEVASDKTKYLSFHSWRSDFEIIPEHNDETGFCELCRRLQMDSLGYKTYEDVRQWHESNQCDNDYGHHYLNN